jgi:thiol-disulfide isomerase/thioredoxin
MWPRSIIRAAISRPRIARLSALTYCSLACWFFLTVAANAAEPPATAVLHLTDESFLPGQIQGSADPKVLRWLSPWFTQPLDFPLSAVRAVHHAVPAAHLKPTGEYCFELAGDDVVYGNLLGLTGDDLEVDVARIGRVHLRREQIGRFYPCHGTDSLYLGPDGLAGWKDPGATPQWRDEGGQLVTDRSGASLVGDFGIPAKAVIEFELSWKRKPDFVFALGVNDQNATVQHAFRLEVWDNDLVAVAESDRDGDVATIEQLGPGEGHIRLQVYLDQAQGRVLLFSRNGKPLATLNINAKKRQILSAVRLTNLKGDVRLEHLRITRWNDVGPRQEWKDQARLQRIDGSIVYGQLTAYNAKLKQFTLRDGTMETLVNQDAVADVFLSASLNVPTTSPDRTLRVVYHDGSRFSGKPTRIEDTHLSLTCPGVKEPLRLPLAGVRSLVALSKGDSPAASLAEGRAGRLEMDGVRLKGRLVAGSEQPNASCLVWRSDLGLNASPLPYGVSGRIVYKEPPPPKPSAPVLRGRIVRGQAKQVIEGYRVQPPTGGRRSMHLCSGDTIPCEVARIDDKGVTLKTPLSDVTFVPHEKIKSVELIPTNSPRLNKTKRERLLTLPRMQKDSPPTHLICSTNGDFLRGRILEMDDTRLRVEVRLETRDIPRERVAQIIWLHPEELAGQKTSPTAADSGRAMRVQTLRAPDDRLTFMAQKLEHNTLSGTSDVLGPCKADLAGVDELLFGTFIDQSASKLAYHLWKLHHATEPKFAQGGAPAGGSNGIESPLVGQPAFAFTLDLLDGRQFKLADHKGRLIVLDFWATWCGPCMQSMPLVDGVVREFAGQQVELIAVNLEEQPEQVKSMLERHKLKVAVALDRDGVVAAKYNVTAIPQTVVIDRDGKVARLFIGGGQNTADSLRKALQELSVSKPASAPTP